MSSNALGNDMDIGGITTADLRDDAIDLYTCSSSHIMDDLFNVTDVLSVLSVLSSLGIIGVIKIIDD